MTPELIAAIILFLGTATTAVKTWTANNARKNEIETIRNERADSKRERDHENELLAYRVAQLEETVKQHDGIFKSILETLNEIRIDVAVLVSEHQKKNGK